MLNSQIKPISQQPAATTGPVSDWLGETRSSQIPVGLGFRTTSERAVSAHEHVYLEGDAQTHMYQVLEGVIGVYKLLTDGRRQIVTFHYPGELIGLDQTGYFIDSAEALCSARIRCIPIDAVDTLIATEPGFGQAMMRLLSTELADTREQLLSLGRKSAMEKLATFMVRIVMRNKRNGIDSNSIHLPMTRSEIADYLGLTVETVSRNFTKLKESTVIRLCSNSVVEVLDVSRLEAIADGSA